MKWFALLKNFPLIILFLLLDKSKQQMVLADLYSRKNVRRSLPSSIPDLAAELESPYFRILFYNRHNNLASKILRVFYGGEKTFIIDVNTKLGPGVRLAHPYATILNAESIGGNLYVNHLVTVGEINGKKPTIGNNVELHANCTVIGDISIGDNAVIGAGAVVVKNVPAGTVVVGNPAKILSKDV